MLTTTNPKISFAPHPAEEVKKQFSLSEHKKYSKLGPPQSSEQTIESSFASHNPFPHIGNSCGVASVHLLWMQEYPVQHVEFALHSCGFAQEGGVPPPPPPGGVVPGMAFIVIFVVVRFETELPEESMHQLPLISQVPTTFIDFVPRYTVPL